jgi:hypothetical protein
MRKKYTKNGGKKLKMQEENKEVWSEYMRFQRRLRNIGVNVQFVGNVPWIYLRWVNGKPVKDNYKGNHGFTAFWYPTRNEEKVKFTDRRKVFAKVRETLQ